MTLVSIADLVAGARSGRVISFPTDTVSALAVLPERADLLFATKQRSQNKAVILMGATSAQLWPFVTGSSNEWQVFQQVAATYWPGALTLVLPASVLVPRAMHPADPTTIGLRVPNCAIAQRILSQTGPLATTSANLSGQMPIHSPAEIAAQFPDVLTLLSLESPVESVTGVPSTVAKWTSCGWEILRQGAVKLEF